MSYFFFFFDVAPSPLLWCRRADFFKDWYFHFRYFFLFFAAEYLSTFSLLFSLIIDSFLHFFIDDIFADYFIFASFFFFFFIIFFFFALVWCSIDDAFRFSLFSSPLFSLFLSFISDAATLLPCFSFFDYWLSIFFFFRWPFSSSSIFAHYVSIFITISFLFFDIFFSSTLFIFDVKIRAISLHFLRWLFHLFSFVKHFDDVLSHFDNISLFLRVAFSAEIFFTCVRRSWLFHYLCAAR